MLSTSQRIVLVISDLHAGSIASPIPKGMVRHDGQEIKPSYVQRYLNHQWTKQTAAALAAIGSDPFDLILNGDMIEGQHHRSTEVWSADPGDHLLAAWKMLNPIAERATNVYAVRGTECHTGPSSEAGLAARLGAVANRETTHGAFDRLDLNVHGCHCRFVHHMPTSTRIGLYATALGVMLNEHQSQAARFGREVPKVIVQGHRHTFGVYSDGAGMSMSCPAWQLLTRFGHKVATASQCRVGSVVLDWRKRDRGALPDVRTFIGEPDGE